MRVRWQDSVAARPEIRAQVRRERQAMPFWLRALDHIFAPRLHRDHAGWMATCGYWIVSWDRADRMGLLIGREWLSVDQRSLAGVVEGWRRGRR